MNTAEPGRFVIIASQRTGSNMLVSALSSHPDLSCHGELFRRNMKHFKGAVQIVASLDARFHDEDYHMEHWQDYLDAVVASSGPVSAVGFKIMLNQHEVARESLINDPDYKIIFLKRENVLSVYSSNKVARKTGQGTVGRFAEVKTKKVGFNAREFEKFRSKYEALYDVAEAALCASGQPFHKTSYTEICKPVGVNAVLDYLGVGRVQTIEVYTKKRNSPELLKRFYNPEELTEYLEKIGKTDWLQEQGEIIPAVAEQVRVE